MYRQSEKNLLSSNISSICLHNMVNFSPLAAEIVSLVWGTPANFNRLRVLAVLLHGTLVVGVSQILRRWTEGATYIWQGGHHVGHWPTFLVLNKFRTDGLPFDILQTKCVEYLVILNYFFYNSASINKLINKTKIEIQKTSASCVSHIIFKIVNRFPVIRICIVCTIIEVSLFANLNI